MYKVVKRDGAVAEFDIAKISAAISKAFDALNKQTHPTVIDLLALKVTSDFEFRTTVVRELHNAEDFEKIGEWLKGDEKYFLQSFTDSDFVLQKGLSAHSRETLRTFADIVRKNVPRVEIRGV